MNSENLATSPPLKFRAVHKVTKHTWYFTFAEIIRDDAGTAIVVPETEDYSADMVLLSECHVDLFTGHYDKGGKGGKEIYGGDVVCRKGDVFLVYWNEDGLWCGRHPSSALEEQDPDTSLWAITKYGGCNVIGNIHNPATLPEEVGNLLK